MSTHDRSDVLSHALDVTAHLCKLLAGLAVGVAIIVTAFGGDAMWAVWTAAGLLAGFLVASLLSRLAEPSGGPRHD